MKFLKNRLLPGFFFGIVFCSFLIPLTIFGSHNSLMGKIIRTISLGGVFILSYVLCYELLNTFHIPLKFNLLLCFLFSLLTFLPINKFVNIFDIAWVDNINSQSIFDTQNTLLKEFIKNLFIDYQSIILILIVSFFFALIELKFNFYNTKNDKFLRWLYVFISLYLISIATKALFYFVAFSYIYWILIIMVPFITDTTGYLVGNKFGRKWIKIGLAPHISPRKSWEGAISGFIFAMLFIYLFCFSGKLFFGSIWAILLAGMFLPFLAILGDLYFSLLKRVNYVKDYSNLLKDHGGLLDRVDSQIFTLSAAALIFFTCL